MSERPDVHADPFGDDERTAIDGDELPGAETRVTTPEPGTDVDIGLTVAPSEGGAPTQVTLTLDELRPRIGDHGSQSPRTETAIRAPAVGFDDPGRTEERPTVAPSPGAAPAPVTEPVTEPAPVPSRAVPRAPARGGMRWLWPVAVLLVLAAGGGGLALMLGAEESEPVAMPTRQPPASAGSDEAPAVEPPPSGVAPPLRDAAQLVASGRFAEAATAYALLARDHPERPELATMARILRRKARR